MYTLPIFYVSCPLLSFEVTGDAALFYVDGKGHFCPDFKIM